MENSETGKPLWHDLTVQSPVNLKPFYEAVCDWKPVDHDMGDYVDYVMTTPDGTHAAGLCHARGENANMPPVWLMYVSVASLEKSLEQVKIHGGEILEQRGSFAVIQDPAGAYFALWEAKEQKAET